MTKNIFISAYSGISGANKSISATIHASSDLSGTKKPGRRDWVAHCELIESEYDLNNDQIMPALQSGRYPEQMRRFFLTSYF
jgi:hypothetical protein